MSDGSLSQDEIDALLQGGGGFDLGDAMPAEGVPAAGAPTGGAGLSESQKAELANVLGGLTDTLASSLSSLVGSSVTIGNPTIEEIANGSFVNSLPSEVVQIGLDFTGGEPGAHSFIFSPEIATTIAGLMMGQEDIELNEAALSALEEAGNTLSGAEATAFSEQTGRDIGLAPSESKTAASGEVTVPDGTFVKAAYSVTIEGQPPSELTEVFEMPFARMLVGGGEAPQAAFDGAAAASPDTGADLLGGMDFGGGQDLTGGGDMGFGMQQSPPSVQAVQFPGLSSGGAPQEQGNISLLMDVYMEMTVELGRTKKLIRDILGMGEGTILELDKLAGEPVDILVNHKLIAKGEVVVIDENFGVRVTEIVDPMERVPEM